MNTESKSYQASDKITRRKILDKRKRLREFETAYLAFLRFGEVDEPEPSLFGLSRAQTTALIDHCVQLVAKEKRYAADRRRHD